MVAGNPACDTAAGPPAVKFLRPRPIQPDKPLFVFLPGMDGTGELLRPQLDRLTPRFDLRALAISPQDFSDWAPLARQVNCLIRQELGLDAAGRGAKGRDRPRRVYLCGESFGGCLAMQVLALSPQLFERAILVNPASSFRRLPWMQLGSVLTRQLPASLYRYSSRGIVPFLIETHRVARRDRQALEAAMNTIPAKTAAWRMAMLGHFKVEHLPLERMTHPVLLIAGGRDRLLPSQREAKSLQARFPNAQLTLLPDSGHACLLEIETDLCRLMQRYEFLTP